MTAADREFSNIRNINSFIDSIPDWSWTNGIFTNKKIRITDGDGMLERAGHLLLLEVKSEGKAIPFGQQLMFSNLSKSKTASIVVLWGKNDVYSKMRVYTENGKYKEFDDIDNDRVIDVLQQWERWAMKNPKV